MAVLIEGVHALGAHQVHALLSVWESVLNPDAIVLLNSIKHLVRLCIEPASIQTAGSTHIAQAVLQRHRQCACVRQSVSIVPGSQLSSTGTVNGCMALASSMHASDL